MELKGGGHAAGRPSLRSGVRWRRRRAWRQRRNTSGSCERSRAPTRPASGPRSGIQGPGLPTGARAGQGAGRLRGHGSAQPSQGQRRPLPSESRASHLHPWRGGSPSGAPPWGPFPVAAFHTPGTLEAPRLPSGRGNFPSPSEAGPPPATGTRRTDGGFITSSPEDISPLPPTRTPFRSADRIEFHPMVCCLGIKLLPPYNHNHFSEMSS